MCLQRFLVLLLLCISNNAFALNAPKLAEASNSLFGYRETIKTNMSLFPQWLSVLEQHIHEMTPEGQCDAKVFNRCHMREWLTFLESIQHLNEEQQIIKVNRYANEKEYVLDIENYGIEDYWATPKGFLQNNGDCEDYAIIKMLSLKLLGFNVETMRIVVVQDTNQRIAHAVMSLARRNDILILDNQIEEIISHRDIYHYVPVYSVNERNWWMHLPK
jgi:predicted transglutaminase-like cysteine proteinase